MDEQKYIRVRGAREHNLKSVNIDIPRDQLVVVTGLSGSGKSTLAFDTLYAEGQRKYVESLSAYARQFLEQMAKPEVEYIEGLPPTIAIEQRSGGGSPRSTVATTTEIYDYLRLLFARVGKPHCWHCGRPIERQSPSQIVDAIMAIEPETRVLLLAPLVRGQKGLHQDLIRHVQREGFVRIRIDGEIYDIKTLPDLNKNKKHTIDVVVDRLVLKPDLRARLADSVEVGLNVGDSALIVSCEQPDGKWVDQLYSAQFACPRHPEASLAELAPRLFSFNSPYGACPDCNGLGTVLEFDPELIIPDEDLVLGGGAIDAWRHGGKRMNILYTKLLREFCAGFQISPEVPYRNLPERIRRILLHGTQPEDEAEFEASFEGVIPNLQRRWESTESAYVKQRLHTYLSERPCVGCKGGRLRPEALAVRIGDKNLRDITSMTVSQAHAFFASLALEGEKKVIAERVLREIQHRLEFMTSVGVGYLALDRISATLSGGEAQRIRLATQVGSGLVGVCYVLDEPTIGLHQRDSGRLIQTLRNLTEIGNTVLVVEHDEETIRAADYLVDMGPGAGEHGGQVVAAGPVDAVLANEESLTAQYLRGEREIPLPSRRRRASLANSIQVKDAHENNLKHLDVEIPLGCFVCVTGVSGSGKSTLVTQILLPAMKRRVLGSRDKPGKHERLVGASRVDKVVEIDQSPIGRTPRSNPATYTSVFDLIRQVFAKTREAKIRGYSAGRFSFNVKGGRCEACQGQGTKRIEMHFLPDVFVACDVCKGARYNRETLEVRYRGKTIADVLDLRVEDAIRFFENFAQIKQLLHALSDVGLAYITLGQSSTTLSGGEAQRVKLAAELGKPTNGHTLYVLDEPTTGLHFADIQGLLSVLNRLVDMGNTVLVIEHNLDVIKVADWIIDLGPEGGDAGGEIVAQGRPEDIAKDPNSHTGQFLAPRLNRNRSKRRAAP
ncbi:MAG: excinuclease ABC subunit UvrA [Phycisphaerae bacterium]|nr:excinuclease ABC subunit UvrA [Phycisphaerae bacterium]